MSHFVYILVESDKFKIGLSNNVQARATAVMPKFIKNKSWALQFEKRREAHNCERTLHWLFRQYNLPPIKGQDGSSELFALDALSDVRNFVKNNKNTINYSRIVRGKTLFPPSPPSTSTAERKRKRTIMREASRFLTTNMMQHRKKGELLSCALEYLLAQNIIVGKILHNSPWPDINPETLIVVHSKNGYAGEIARHIFDCGAFVPWPFNFCHLFSTAVSDDHIGLIKSSFERFFTECTSCSYYDKAREIIRDIPIIQDNSPEMKMYHTFQKRWFSDLSLSSGK
ncbi:MAG: GIY-YIG nuclease family protein [Bdellovibrionales bacterium]